MKIIIATKTITAINAQANTVKAEMVAAKLIRKSDSAAKPVTEAALRKNLDGVCANVNSFEHFSMENNGAEVVFEVKDELLIKIVIAVAKVVVPYARFMASAKEIAVKHLKPLQKLVYKKAKVKTIKQALALPINQNRITTKDVKASRKAMDKAAAKPVAAKPARRVNGYKG